jgi:serine/threonine protein kinase
MSTNTKTKSDPLNKTSSTGQFSAASAQRR